eukprot:TRINITY_DN55434_c0_g1_i1.p1 TRINITY_DN55434_c0_g1~~TRINITY_DN55434_c0_g1_i1.p1  ORF type:complete len:291 (-),score=69.80 TRINITY_DN55434_c0_g1_i1:9-881(-)
MAAEVTSGLSAVAPAADCTVDPDAASARSRSRSSGSPCAKRLRAGAEAEASAAVLLIGDELEARSAGSRGNGVFARCVLPVGFLWRDEAVSVSVDDGDGREDRGASSDGAVAARRRRLPNVHNIDELMCEVSRRADLKSLREGPWKLSHLQRHLEMQDTTDEELPEWARSLALASADYNLLAAQLQSNVASDGEGVVLCPLIHLANHACDGNSEFAPCPDGAGHFVLRVLRPVAPGEELTYSYLGDQLLGDQDVEERRAVLRRRWGFDCCCSLCERQLKSVAERAPSFSF